MARILVAANESDKARDHLQQAENLAIDDSVRKEIQKVQDDLDAGNWIGPRVVYDEHKQDE